MQPTKSLCDLIFTFNHVASMSELSFFSRQFWKTVNSVNGRQYSSRIGPLKDHNDLEVLDDGLKAKLFNQYFANIGKEIAESFPEENQSILRHIYRVTSPTCSTLELETSNITNSLRAIKANKAADLNNISSTIIPLSGSAIVEGLTRVFKRSFDSRSMPLDLCLICGRERKSYLHLRKALNL